MFILYRRSIVSRLGLVLALVFSMGLARVAISQETMAQAMANAIARMMESMGFTDRGVGGAPGPLPGVVPPIPYDPMGSRGWPSAFGAWPGTQGYPGRAGPLPGGSQMNQMAEALRQTMPLPGRGGGMRWGASILEGVWEDNQGGMLIVQGGRYRIYSSCNGYIDGDIRVGADRVGLTNPQEDFTQTFEFALDQGRLALRNAQGQVFLYRRLVLDRR